MKTKKISFIGGGRITNIFLTAFKRNNISFEQIIVMDTNPEVLKNLSVKFPEIKVKANIDKELLGANYLFMAVHPPVIAESLEKIKSELNPETIIISLAPKFTIEKMSTILGGFNRIVRLLPLASSIIGEGYNPVVFGKSIDVDSKKSLLNLFDVFGQTVEVAEPKMEAYALIVAMGPTYLWFQYYEMLELAKSFGMEPTEAMDAVRNMLNATIKTMFDSGLDKAGVIDLIPVKPIGEHEQDIVKIYNEKLNALFQKIKP